MEIPIEQQVSQLRGYIESLQRTLEHQTTIMVNVHDELGQLRRDNIELRGITVTQRKTIAYLQTEVTSLKERLNDIINEKAKYIQEAQKYRAMFEFMQRENNALREENRRLNESPRP